MQGSVIYAVGDIHGELELLNRLMSAINADVSDRALGNAEIVFVGDYVDRGPASKGVVDRLMSGFPETGGFSYRFLLGNHEQLFLDFVDRQDPDLARNWFRYVNGGKETLRSYGLDVKAIEKAVQKGKDLGALLEPIPSAHLDWMRELDLYYETPDYFFVHAGILPGVPFDRQLKKDLIWIREAFLDDKEDHGKIVVHGHTPSRKAERKSNRINVDTGACFWGTLTAVALEPTAADVEPRFIQVSK